MKIKVLLITIAVLFIVSCAGTGNDIDTLKTQLESHKAELSESEKAVKMHQDSIASLEERIRLMGGGEVKINLKPVQALKIEKDTFRHYVNISGEVEASNNVLVNPEMPGSITRIFVKEGQKVSKGQTLISLDASVVQSNIAELESQLEFATTMYDKQKRLYDQNIGSEVQYLQAKNQKESLENSIRTLRSQGGKYSIKSPISGVVDEIFPNIGEGASPGMPVARIVNLSKVFVESELSESYLGKISINDPVEVTFKSIGLNMTGKVIQIGQFIDENNRTFKIKIDLDEDNEMIKPNLLASVKLVDYENPASIAVPSKIILEDLKGKYIYVVNEGEEHKHVNKRYISTGVYADADIEIVDGLENDDMVVIEGYSDLAEGEKVIVQ